MKRISTRRALGFAGLLAIAGLAGATVPAAASPASGSSDGQGLVITPFAGDLRPATGTTCVGLSRRDPAETCMHVEGSGLYVKHMTMGTLARREATDHLEFRGPGLHYNTPSFHLKAGQSEVYIWKTRHEVKAGNYCATTWMYDGSYHNQGTACVGVHR